MSNVKYYGPDEMPWWPSEQHADCPAKSSTGAGRGAFSFLCTRDAGHEGKHKAQGNDERVIAEWS